MLYHIRDRPHAQYIQIHKFIGENEKGILFHFLFYGEKILKDFLASPIENHKLSGL